MSDLAEIWLCPECGSVLPTLHEQAFPPCSDGHGPMTLVVGTEEELNAADQAELEARSRTFSSRIRQARCALEQSVDAVKRRRYELEQRRAR